VGICHHVELPSRRLYPNGLHRDRILPAIELLKEQLEVINVDNGTDYRRRTLEQVQLYHTPAGPAGRCRDGSAFRPAGRGARRRPGAAHRAPRDRARAASRRRGLVRLQDAVRRPALAERLPGDRHAVPHRAAVRRAADAAAHGQRGAALHLAGGRAVRPPRQADHVGRGAARAALHRGAAGARVSAHGVAAARDAVGRVPGAGPARPRPRQLRSSVPASHAKWQRSRRARARPPPPVRAISSCRPVSARFVPTVGRPCGNSSENVPCWTTRIGANVPRSAWRGFASARRLRRATRPVLASRCARAVRPFQRPCRAARAGPPVLTSSLTARPVPQLPRPPRRPSHSVGRRHPQGGPATLQRTGTKWNGETENVPPSSLPRHLCPYRRPCRRPLLASPPFGGSGSALSAAGRCAPSASDRLSPPPRARCRALLTQHLAGFARGQGVHDGAHFLGGEVVPQAVAAGQHVSPIRVGRGATAPSADRRECPGSRSADWTAGGCWPLPR
jgi:hypothetical protein